MKTLYTIILIVASVVCAEARVMRVSNSLTVPVIGYIACDSVNAVGFVLLPAEARSIEFKDGGAVTLTVTAVGGVYAPMDPRAVDYPAGQTGREVLIYDNAGAIERIATLRAVPVSSAGAGSGSMIWGCLAAGLCCGWLLLSPLES
jgi:hypothetical protein